MNQNNSLTSVAHISCSNAASVRHGVGEIEEERIGVARVLPHEVEAALSEQIVAEDSARRVLIGWDQILRQREQAN